MGLQLVLGGSGSGKSTYIYKDVIDKSIENPDSNYIVVVPEQYTMETQRKLVMTHPRKGILNIDVVSFERLAYKVFEEVGGENRAVLDDTGKNLIIRRVLEEKKKELGYFGNSINKIGFVSELKSVISEMLQYDIGLERLNDIMQQTQKNRLLSAKLNDISVVYSGFKEYMSDNYITSEEILDVLCNVIGKSEIIKKSEIVFDGFTGFTPIQYKLMRILLTMCRDIQISVTIDASEKINVYEGMQNLFFMSKDMIQKLYKICDEEHVKIYDNVLLKDKCAPRFEKSEELNFLEKNLFRYNRKVYKEKVDDIHIFAASSPKEEIQYAIAGILKLTRKEGYQYKDIAIVSGDIGQYGLMTGNMLEQNNIPYFLDNKRSITDNPFVEMIRSALEIVEKNYNYDSVFRYLRTGMTGISRENVDVLENYCMAVGIKGRKSWNEPWKKKSRRHEQQYDYEYLEELRKQVIKPLAKLDEAMHTKSSSVRDYVLALYTFIVELESAKKINKLSKYPETGNEYEQLYKKVMELLEKIVELLGNEKISIKEFNRILDAGFEEIKVGLIPPTADCIVVGDIERTRLDNIKVLFFLGMNDGIIPAKNDNRGVLSETDRSYLEELEVVMSPSAREKAFVQKFYLYLIMTKTSEKLYVSYAGKDLSGKSLLPSYMLRSLKIMYPQMDILQSEDASYDIGYIQIPKAGLEWSEENYIRTLSQAVVEKMYGDNISGSVSAFERYASCSFAYFMQYGLRLEEREEHSFQVSDFGTILHAVIESVSREVKKEKLSFSMITDEKRAELVRKSMQDITEVYGNTILKESNRNEFMIGRMTELADRTIWAIGKQLEKGIFKPDDYEMKFMLDSEVVKGKKTLSMIGKIDRIDICEDDANVYVRIVDYKSGKSDFDLLKTFYGLKLQLIMYMRAAKQIEEKKYKNSGKQVIPAGILYYNIDNPIIDLSDESGFASLSEEEQSDKINEMIQEALRMKGLVNDRKDIIKKMDDTEGKSLSIPVAYKKGGQELDNRRSRVISTDEFHELEDYVTKKTIKMTKEIFDGKVDINPYEQGNSNACEYCPYSGVCGFSPDLKKGSYRYVKKMNSEDIWADIKKGVDENGESLD